MNTKDPEGESVLKEDEVTEESPLAHMDEEREEQTTASPDVSHTEPNLVHDNITGERSGNLWSDSKLLGIHNTFISSK